MNHWLNIFHIADSYFSEETIQKTFQRLDVSLKVFEDFILKVDYKNTPDCIQILSLYEKIVAIFQELSVRISLSQAIVGWQISEQFENIFRTSVANFHDKIEWDFYTKISNFPNIFHHLEGFPQYQKAFQDLQERFKKYPNYNLTKDHSDVILHLEDEYFSFRQKYSSQNIYHHEFINNSIDILANIAYEYAWYTEVLGTSIFELFFGDENSVEMRILTVFQELFSNENIEKIRQKYSQLTSRDIETEHDLSDVFDKFVQKFPKLAFIFEKMQWENRIEIQSWVSRYSTFSIGNRDTWPFIIANISDENPLSSVIHEMGHAFMMDVSVHQSVLYEQVSPFLSEVFSIFFELLLAKIDGFGYIVPGKILQIFDLWEMTIFEYGLYKKAKNADIYELKDWIINNWWERFVMVEQIFVSPMYMLAYVFATLMAMKLEEMNDFDLVNNLAVHSGDQKFDSLFQKYGIDIFDRDMYLEIFEKF